MGFQLSPPPKFQFVDPNGNPYVGGKLYTYLVGTSTPQFTYADGAGTPNTNPVTLDANGAAVLFLGSDGYKFSLFDADGGFVWTVDSIFANYLLPTGSQTISDKTFDNSNIFFVKDSQFTVESAGDDTSRFRFSAASITPGATRIITVPDGDFTIAGLQTQNQFTKRNEWIQGAAVTLSGTDLTLGLDGNQFLINGGGTINAITNANWQKGSLITLRFGATTTVKFDVAGSAGTGSFSLLQGGQDFIAGIGDILTVMAVDDGGGITWVEVCRAINSQVDGIIHSVQVTINNAAIKTLPTIDVLAVAAPVTPRFLDVIKVAIYSDVAAGVYTNVDGTATLYLVTATGVRVTDTMDHTILNGSAAKRMVQVAPGMAAGASGLFSDFDNSQLFLHAYNNGAGNFTGGASANKLEVFVTYMVREATP